MEKYIVLRELEVYKLARELSAIGWEIYEGLNFGDKKIMGDQFIEACDSVGANIAEGYGRYHYMDRIKFYYNSRASLMEACEHWIELLMERRKIKKDNYAQVKSIYDNLGYKLNNFIRAVYRSKK